MSEFLAHLTNLVMLLFFPLKEDSFKSFFFSVKKVLDTTERGSELGSNILFREAAEIGWNFYGKDSISLRFDHISNANLWGEDANEGLDTFGVVYSYRF